MRHFERTWMAAAHSVRGRGVISGTVLRLRRCLRKERSLRRERRGNGHSRPVHKIAASDAAVHAQFLVSPTHRLIVLGTLVRPSWGSLGRLGQEPFFHYLCARLAARHQPLRKEDGDDRKQKDKRGDGIHLRGRAAAQP